MSTIRAKNTAENKKKKSYIYMKNIWNLSKTLHDLSKNKQINKKS